MMMSGPRLRVGAIRSSLEGEIEDGILSVQTTMLGAGCGVLR